MEKKPEMVRRTKIIKFLKESLNAYEVAHSAGANEMYLKGYAEPINKLIDELNVSGWELEQDK